MPKFPADDESLEEDANDDGNFSGTQEMFGIKIR
jgi:hypothetical protein